MAADRIKLVVAEGHTLGYIIPSLPNYLQILKASTLMGSYYGDGSIMLPKDHRLATAQDFQNFNVSSKGFMNPDEYEYDTSFQTVLEYNPRFNTCWNSSQKKWETNYNDPILSFSS